MGGVGSTLFGCFDILGGVEGELPQAARKADVQESVRGGFYAVVPEDAGVVLHVLEHCGGAQIRLGTFKLE